MDALEQLTGDAQTFCDKVWASRVLVHPTTSGAGALLGLDDVDHLLTGAGLRTPALRMARDGTVVPSARYTRTATLAGVSMTGLVDARKVIDLFDDGATVVLQGLHRYWPPLRDLVRDLELALGHPCQANAYLTPPGSQGFALHSDTHDVFVVQTHGVKHWEVHEGDDVREVVMEPGTCLYMPTGTPHAARTTGQASLHVTVGVNRVTWRRALERAVGQVLDRLGEDTPLPAGYHHAPGDLAEGLAARLRSLADALTAHDPQALATAEVERFLTNRPSRLPGGLRDRLDLRSLHDGTRLVRRTGVPCVVVPAGSRLRILLGDRELRVPGWLAAAVEHVAGCAELRPADLSPWLDEESRRVLARRLVAEGLLAVGREEPPGHEDRG